MTKTVWILHSNKIAGGVIGVFDIFNSLRNFIQNGDTKQYSIFLLSHHTNELPDFPFLTNIDDISSADHIVSQENICSIEDGWVSSCKVEIIYDDGCPR